jgi:hypothetical protein
MSFSHEVVVLYILKLYGIVELQFMLGCLWKQFVISVSLLFRLWQDLRKTACQRREEIGDGRMYNNKWVELSVCLPQKTNILSPIIYFVYSMNEIILTPLTA